MRIGLQKGARSLFGIPNIEKGHSKLWKSIQSVKLAQIPTWVTFLKRRPSEVFARVDKLAGKGARVDGVKEGARVGEAGGGGRDGVVVGRAAS